MTVKLTSMAGETGLAFEQARIGRERDIRKRLELGEAPEGAAGVVRVQITWNNTPSPVMYGRPPLGKGFGAWWLGRGAVMYTASLFAILGSRAHM